MIKKTSPKKIYDEAYTYKIVHKHNKKQQIAVLDVISLILHDS